MFALGFPAVGVVLAQLKQAGPLLGPCDGGRAGPAGGSCRVAPSSGCCYFWQADYIMSRDGFANPGLYARAHLCVCV